ncbi:MAG: hypothetical protein O2917_00400, partial [Acidobacteria bacterium]|nr:hypothetical protein [Acidobacteriota bacterium]
MKSRLIVGCGVAVLSAAALVAQAPVPTPLPAQPFDLLVQGGRVYDGTGNPAFPADIGIRDGRIVALGRLAGAKATRVIDATGKHVSPRFIDIHSHA